MVGSVLQKNQKKEEPAVPRGYAYSGMHACMHMLDRQTPNALLGSCKDWSHTPTDECGCSEIYHKRVSWLEWVFLLVV